jgi:hypothetical protein
MTAVPSKQPITEQTGREDFQQIVSVFKSRVVTGQQEEDIGGIILSLDNRNMSVDAASDIGIPQRNPAAAKLPGEEFTGRLPSPPGIPEVMPVDPGKSRLRTTGM